MPNGRWPRGQFLGTTGNELSSATWDYKTVTWKEGEKIIVVNQILKYLRTTPDNTVKDNLDNLIPMNQLIG
jgi:hypothetical protein